MLMLMIVMGVTNQRYHHHHHDHSYARHCGRWKDVTKAGLFCIETDSKKLLGGSDRGLQASSLSSTLALCRRRWSCAG